MPLNKKADLPTVLQGYMDQGERVSSFPIHEYWLDVGKISDFELAQKNFNSRVF